MQEVNRKLTEVWDNLGLSMAVMVERTGLSEATLRRVRAGEKGINLSTAAAVARALSVSLDELTGLDIPKPPALVEPPAVPPARDTWPELRELYEMRLAEQKKQHDETNALYERAIASGKKRETIKTIAIVILSIILAIYFLYFDVRNGSWGFVQYSKAFSAQDPNTTSILHTFVRYI